MKTLNTILSSVALMLASSVAVEADFLLAGPIPANVNHGTLTCSATNIHPDGSGLNETITFFVEDANDNDLPFTSTCPGAGLIPTASCSVTVDLGSIVTPPLPVSPFVCNISSTNTRAPLQPAPVRGSICATLNDSTTCLQALLDNATSP
jgi:hypothetical protein